MFNRMHVKSIATPMASIATNASAIQPIFRFPAAGEVVGLRFTASTSQPAATTTASGLTVTLYKNASTQVRLSVRSTRPAQDLRRMQVRRGC